MTGTVELGAAAPSVKQACRRFLAAAAVPNVRLRTRAEGTWTERISAPTRALRLDGKVIREADGFFEVAVGLYGKEAISQITLEGFEVVAQG